MHKFLLLIIFVFIFWFIYILGRILQSTYIWQVKEYRWDRIKVFLKDSNIISIIYKTLISSVLFVFILILSKFIYIKWLYLILVVGFSYYVYLALNTFTKLLNKKIHLPKKSVRNLLIVSSCVLLSLLPILLSYLFFISIYEESVQPTEAIESTQLYNVFPEEIESGVYTIPLETASIIILFRYLFVFDILLPALLAFSVFITSIFSSQLRKKKSKTQK